MSKVNHNNKIYTSLESIILDFTYSEFVYFIYNCLKENYNKYEVLKEINFKQFKINISF